MGNDRQVPTGGKLTRVLLVAAGSLSLGLGMTGIFLPHVPTTPLLLPAAAGYIRSSPELYHRLSGSRWPGRYMRDYRERRGIPAAIKVLTISAL